MEALTVGEVAFLTTFLPSCQCRLQGIEQLEERRAGWGALPAAPPFIVTPPPGSLSPAHRHILLARSEDLIGTAIPGFRFEQWGWGLGRVLNRSWCCPSDYLAGVVRGGPTPAQGQKPIGLEVGPGAKRQDGTIVMVLWVLVSLASKSPRWLPESLRIHSNWSS